MTATGCAELDVEEIGRLVRREMGQRAVPGLALAVVSPDRPVWTAGFGTTAVYEGMPVTGQTVFRIASVTKVLTGIALMRLVDDGTLTLDTPVMAHLPRLRLRTPGAAEQLTLRMLLSHTSGLPEGSVERPWQVERRDPDGLAAFVAQDLPRFPMVGRPGELYFYSNLAINLAGFLAQTATGVPFERLLDELVVRPLGLRRTTLDPTVAMTYPLAQRHTCDEDGVLRVRRDGGDNTAFYPAGYAFSTADDLATVLRLLIGGGAVDGTRLLSRDAVHLMQTPHADIRLSRGLHYGLTSVIEPDYKGIRRIGHEGVLRGYCAKITYAPDHGVGVAVLYNHEYNERPRFFAARERIVDRVFDQLLDLPHGPVRLDTDPVPSSMPARLAGRYAKVLDPTVVELRTDEEGLALRFDGVDVPLAASGPGTLAGPRSDRDLADLPWPRTPYVIDDHVTVGVPPSTQDVVPTITINGQPYRRVRV